MSSLEMLALLELAQGRPLIHGLERDQASGRWAAFLPTIRRLIAFGKRSLLVLVLLALWEAIPRLGLADPTFLPPFSLPYTHYSLIARSEAAQRRFQQNSAGGEGCRSRGRPFHPPSVVRQPG